MSGSSSHIHFVDQSAGDSKPICKAATIILSSVKECESAHTAIEFTHVHFAIEGEASSEAIEQRISQAFDDLCNFEFDRSTMTGHFVTIDGFPEQGDRFDVWYRETLLEDK